MSELVVRDLVKDFRGARGRTHTRAVDHVSLTLRSGTTTALVGESGSGKSTVARVLARLEQPTAGHVSLDGRELERGRRAVRAYRSQVQMVFQDPFGSLNPAHTIGHHLAIPLRVYGIARGKEAMRAEIRSLLERVRLHPADEIAERYPHELSGGQRQRVAIARALAPRPRVLLADEPVSMLDVSVRLEILNLLDDLKRAENLAVLYITHDLATARHFSSQVLVMYRGSVVEEGPADEVILTPRHPYTQLLAEAAPDATRGHRAPRGRRRAEREAAEGTGGCPFAGRCPHVMPACTAAPPAAVGVGADHSVRCLLHADGHDRKAAAAGTP